MEWKYFEFCEDYRGYKQKFVRILFQFQQSPGSIQGNGDFSCFLGERLVYSKKKLKKNWLIRLNAILVDKIKH